MIHFRNPSWINHNLLKAESIDEIGEEVYTTINKNLELSQVGDTPLVSVVIPVKNEELNILRCLDSLAKNKTSFPFEILVVNNNSDDQTPEVLKRLNVKTYDQPVAGIGHTRQFGMERAQGKFILTADADCLYHKNWIEVMTNTLKKKGVVCVTGKYSFLGDEKTSRFFLQIYESFRSIVIRIRQRKHPYLNTWGGNMGYLKEPALKIKYDTRSIRGEDGRLCFDLMSYGNVVLNNKTAAHVWTNHDTIISEGGTLMEGIWANIYRELYRFVGYFKPPKPHDTKTSSNTNEDIKAKKHSLKKNG